MSQKKGNGAYRVLMVDNSEQSKAAIEFMDSLNVAYIKQDLTGYHTPGITLPAVCAPSGTVFQGLENIKKYQAALGLVVSEVVGDPPHDEPGA